MCAVRALNGLAQQPMFQAVEFAQIAQHLDRAEAALLGEDAAASGGESHNVSADGNFSFPVLMRALAQIGLELVNVTKPEAVEAVDKPLGEEGFIIQSAGRAHWWCLRKVWSKWYGLCCVFVGEVCVRSGACFRFVLGCLQA